MLWFASPYLLAPFWTPWGNVGSLVAPPAWKASLTGSVSCFQLQHGIPVTWLWLPEVRFWLLGSSLSWGGGLCLLILQTAIVGLFFPLFMVCDHCQHFFSPRSAFKYATFVLLYVDAGWTVMINQVLGALWGKCWWRNTFEENFSLSSSYLRKQAPFIFLGLMWDEYRPPRTVGLPIRGRKWGLSLALGFFKHWCYYWVLLLPPPHPTPPQALYLTFQVW